MPSDPVALANKSSNSQTRYQILHQQIGKGTYSTIHLGKDLTTGQQVAVKVMDLRRYTREFSSEARVLARLDHEGIVKFRHSQIVQDTGYIYMDYIPHPNLFNYVRRNRCLSQEHSLTIFCNILSAMEIIHGEGIAHRDLKPDNIMVDPKTLNTVILDFGLSMMVPLSGLSENYCGSPLYMSPEALNQEKHDPQLADLWSLGVILYHMLVGDSPWSYVESLDDLLDLVVFETTVKLPPFLSAETKDLLGGILVHQPTARLPLQAIKQKVKAIIG